MIPSKPIDVAILGATGAVGQRFIQLLEGHPWFRIAELVASERSAGRTYAEAARWVLSGNPSANVAQMTVVPLDSELRSPVVFSALPSDIAKTIEWRLASEGHIVCSNASAYRMHDHVPILLPEINAEHVGLVDVQRQKYGWTTGALVTNSNCTSAPVAMSLAPLRSFGIDAVHLVSMQAISGAGYPGVPSLDILDNVIPYIGGEEPKLEMESRKMLGALDGEQIAYLEYNASATCTRVPVLDSHLVAVSVRFKEAISQSEIYAAWEAFRGPDPVPELPTAPEVPVEVSYADDRLQPRRDRDAGNGMATVVGRLRKDAVIGGWKYLALAHNTVRGAAGCSILNAELLVARDYLG